MFTAQLHYNVSNDIPLLSLSTQNGKQDEKKKIYIYSLDSTRCFVRVTTVTTPSRASRGITVRRVTGEQSDTTRLPRVRHRPPPFAFWAFRPNTCLSPLRPKHRCQFKFPITFQKWKYRGGEPADK